MAENKSNLVEVKLRMQSGDAGPIRNNLDGTAKLVAVIGISLIRDKQSELVCLFDKSIKAKQTLEILNMQPASLTTYESNGHSIAFHNLNNNKVLKVVTKL